MGYANCFVCQKKTEYTSPEMKWCKRCKKHFCTSCGYEKQYCPECKTLGSRAYFQQNIRNQKILRAIRLIMMLSLLIVVTYFVFKPDNSKIFKVQSKHKKTPESIKSEEKEQSKPIAVSKKSDFKNAEPSIHKGTLSLEYIKKQLSLVKDAPSQCQPGVIVLPLTDYNDKTVPEGTLLALLGMFHATFLPDKLLNLSFSELENFYCYAGFARAGNSIKKWMKEKLIAHHSACAFAEGSFEFNDHSYFIKLQFQGKYGTKVYEKQFPKKELIQCPSWIANCIHEYLRIKLTQEQQAYLERSEYTKEEDFLQVANILDSSWRTSWRKMPRFWDEVCKRNPESVFYASCRLHSLRAFRDISALRAINFLSQQYPNHEFLNYRKAEFLASINNHIDALSLFFEILLRDWRNPSVYEELKNIFLYYKQWEGTELLFQTWYEKDTSSYLPAFFLGEFYLHYAWHFRGGDRAKAVSTEQWKLFSDHLKKAESLLKKAYELNPLDYRASSSLITVCNGLNYDYETMEQWFQRSIAANPENLFTYVLKLEYLMPKWHGSLEKMFAYARHISSQSPKDSIVRILLVYAHDEMAAPYNLGEKYYQNPKVWTDIQDCYESYLHHHPYCLSVRDEYAARALAAEKYEIAAEQLKYLTVENLPTCLENRSNVNARNYVDDYFRLADVYLKKQDTKMAFHWLENGLRIDPNRFEYHCQYARLLMQEKKWQEALHHYSIVSDKAPISKWKKEAKYKIIQLRNMIENAEYKEEILALPGYTLYLTYWGEVEEEILNGIQKRIGEIFGFPVERLQEPFQPDKSALIPKQSIKIKETMDWLIRELGWDKIKALASSWKISAEELGTDRGRYRFLEIYMSERPENRETWQYIQSMQDQWDGNLLYYQIRNDYGQLIAKPKSIGVLVITSQDIGGRNFNYLFAHSNNNIGIVSYYRYKTPKEMLLDNSIKVSCASVGKILGVGNCRTPTCARSFSNNVEDLHPKKQILCPECNRNIAKAYRAILEKNQ